MSWGPRGPSGLGPPSGAELPSATSGLQGHYWRWRAPTGAGGCHLGLHVQSSQAICLGVPAKPAMEWWCGQEQQSLPEEISLPGSVNSSDPAPAIALHF